MKEKKFHMNKIMSRNPCIGLSAVLEQAANIQERLPHARRGSYSWAVGRVPKLVRDWRKTHQEARKILTVIW